MNSQILLVLLSNMAEEEGGGTRLHSTSVPAWSNLNWFYSVQFHSLFSITLPSLGITGVLEHCRINWRDKLERAKPGLLPRRVPQPLGDFTGYCGRCPWRPVSSCSKQEGNPAEALASRFGWTPLEWRLDVCKLWHGVHRALEHSKNVCAGSNLAETSLIPIWILQIHNISRNPYFLPFSSQIHCLHFYAFDTKASKIMDLTEFKHPRTLGRDWQAISAFYSGKLEDMEQEPTNCLHGSI